MRKLRWRMSEPFDLHNYGHIATTQGIAITAQNFGNHPNGRIGTQGLLRIGARGHWRNSDSERCPPP